MSSLFCSTGNRVLSLGRFLALPVLLLMIEAPSGHAQAASSVTGIVSDPTGRPVPSAGISIKNLETGALRSALTDGTGHLHHRHARGGVTATAGQPGAAP